MKKVLLWLNDHVEEVIMAVMLTVIVFVMTLQIIMRYFFVSSLDWPEEVARYCFIWLVYVGMARATMNDEMIRVNIIEVLVPKAAKVLNVIQDIISTAFLVYMFVPGINILKQLQKFPQFSPAMMIPMSVVFVALEVGIVWSLFRMVQKYVLKFIHWKNNKTNVVPVNKEGAK